MKSFLKVFVALMLLSCFFPRQDARATYIPTQATLTVAGVVFTDAYVNPRFKILHCFMGSNANTSCRVEGGTSGFLPSASFNFETRAVILEVITAGRIETVYTDNDLLVDAGTVPTNPVYRGGDVKNSYIAFATYPLANSKTEIAYRFTTPNGKYTGFRNDTAGATGFITVFGYEVP